VQLRKEDRLVREISEKELTDILDSKLSKTCEIRIPLEAALSVLSSEVSAFQDAICTENSNLGPVEVSLFPRMSSF
jgi:hypothetical protein